MTATKSTTEPPEPPDASAQVRLRIVSAARVHFLLHGFRGVTMDDLALEMATSKKTLYLHFPSKRDLLDAVIDQKLTELATDMDAAAAPVAGESFAEALSRLLACLRQHAQEIGPTFVRDVSKEDPALFAFIKARRRKVITRTFGKLLQSGQTSGAVRRDLAADLLVEILLGIADTVATPENLAARGLAPRDVVNAILSVFLHGALTPKGAAQ